MTKTKRDPNLDTGILSNKEVAIIATGLVGNREAEFESTMRKLITLNNQAQKNNNINSEELFDDSEE